MHLELNRSALQRFRCFSCQQSVFIRMQLLSEDAILHISAGFQGPFIVQAFGIHRQLYNGSVYNFCVTDGTVYIGAKYQTQEDLELDNYSLIQITAKFQDRSSPIIIRTLMVFSNGLKKMVGNLPCTLQDYFKLQTKIVEGQNAPKKRIKPNEQIQATPIQKEMGVKKPANTPKRDHSNQKKQQLKNQSEKKSEVINLQSNDKRLLKLDSSSEDEQAIKNPRIDAMFDLDESQHDAKSNQVLVNQQGDKSNEMEKTGYIKDLYQRCTGWVILCKINYINIVQCQNGLFAANFILSDEQGTEIRCVYFAAELQQARQTLKVGHCYLFSGGEVKFSFKQKELHITFDRNSYIIHQKLQKFHQSTRKFVRIDRILDREHESIISVIGVIHKIKSKERIRAKTKFTATLCDPIKLIEIDFMLFLHNEEKQIQVGMVIVLHNFQIFKQSNIYRLNSTFKSYYYQMHPRDSRESGDDVSQICQIVELSDWQGQKYKNISMFAFTHRNIHDFKQIYKRTSDERLYTSLDVWIFDITLKTSYHACINCKRSTEVKEMKLFECLNCKKMVDTIITHTLCGTFTDYTGSCCLDVIGEHAENILGMKAAEFHSLSPEAQNSHLQSLRYKNVVIRLKSEKKGEKRQNHSVWGIERPTPQISLRQIRKQMQINRLKQEQQW